MRVCSLNLRPPALAMLGLLSFAGEATVAAQPPPPVPEEIQPAPIDKRAEAELHFNKGRELLLKDAWDAALAEFLESRRLHATWSATSSAGACLEHLGRFDESLEMFEALLREFSAALPAGVRTAAQQRITSLRGRTGAITVEEAEPGAALTIDGRARGEYPSLEPLPVLMGSHVVRVYKEGFEAFETTAEAVAGQTLKVKARLRALVRAGRLHVTEKSGKALEVVVDGFGVGETPWEGPIAVGDHTVVLRGQDTFGTQPLLVSIKQDQRAELALTAEDLGASVRAAPAPAGASVAVDGIFVGRGAWEGHLRPGEHPIRVVADGYFAETRIVRLGPGKREAVSVSLRRDPSAPTWRRPGRFTLEIDGYLPVSASFGGDLVASCKSGCERITPFGGEVAFHGGYELGNGFGFGVTSGYLKMQETVRGRATAIKIQWAAPDAGRADDTVKLRGFVAGAYAGMALGERFPVRLRLGAGALIGTVSDARTGMFHVNDTTVKDRYAIGPVIVTPAATWFYLAPEVRAGMRFGKHIEVSAGVSALALIGLSPPRWDKTRGIYGSTDGYGSFGAEAITSSILFAIAPGLGARYDF